MSLPPNQSERALWIALVGLCIQVPLALWLDYLSVRLWAGGDPFGRKWHEFVFIAVAALLVQWWWLRSPQRTERRPGRYL